MNLNEPTGQAIYDAFIHTLQERSEFKASAATFGINVIPTADMLLVSDLESTLIEEGSGSAALLIHGWMVPFRPAPACTAIDGLRIFLRELAGDCIDASEARRIPAPTPRLRSVLGQTGHADDPLGQWLDAIIDWLAAIAYQSPHGDISAALAFLDDIRMIRIVQRQLIVHCPDELQEVA